MPRSAWRPSPTAVTFRSRSQWVVRVEAAPCFTTGRTRWTPDGKAIAYIGQNESGHFGVFVQDFLPGRDTTGTRRPLAGFDAETATESFAISRDGKWLTTAGWEQLSTPADGGTTRR